VQGNSLGKGGTVAVQAVKKEEIIEIGFTIADKHAIISSN